MSALSHRYDRNIRLFGSEGQNRLQAVTVAVAGVGGLGSYVAQHLALLGVGRIVLIDDDELDDTNRNQFIGARHVDPVPGSKKIFLSERLIRETNPDVDVKPIPEQLVSEDAFTAIKSADVSFGCFDEDGPRGILNELCAAYEKPYFDLASDVPDATLMAEGYARHGTAMAAFCAWANSTRVPSNVTSRPIRSERRSIAFMASTKRS